MNGSHEFTLQCTTSGKFTKFDLKILVEYDLDIISDGGAAIIAKSTPTKFTTTVGGNEMDAEPWNQISGHLKRWLLEESKELGSFEDFGITEADAIAELQNADDEQETQNSLRAGAF